MANVDKDIVFVRTELGQKEAFDPASELPRVLRTLLFSIDGRSTAGSYATLLSNFGDVYGHLDLLVEAGYIRPSKSRSRRVGGAAEAASALDDSVPTGMRTTQFEVTAPPRVMPQAMPQAMPQVTPQDSQWGGSRAAQQTTAQAPFSPLAPGPSSAAAGVSGLLRKVLRLGPRVDTTARAWGQSQQFATSVMGAAPDVPQHVALPPAAAPVINPTPLPPQPAPLSEAARLQAARDLMIDFLHLYLPAIAQEASMSIEALHSREQMMRSLPDYTQLVSRTGDAGAAHLAQLHLTLGLMPV
jgi:hypothetical protein